MEEKKQKIEILITLSGCEKTPIGAIENVKITEHRDGYQPTKDGPLVTGLCTRARFDKTRISDIFADGVVHENSQSKPFDIIVSHNIEDGVMKTVVHNVWIRKLPFTYCTDDFFIPQNMEWDAENIYSFLVKETDNGTV